MADCDFELGAIVIDKEQTGSNRAVVVNLPPKKAGEWAVESRNCTLADDNPTYPTDDRVVCVVWLNDLVESFPWYTGYKFLKLGQIKYSRATHYAFPESRLEKVGERSGFNLPLSALSPSPYHVRDFSAGDEDSMIQQAREQGTTYGQLIVRDTGEGFNIVNGHRRAWGAREAGLETHTCQVVYLSDTAETEWFLDSHFTGGEHQEAYSKQEKKECIDLVKDRWGEDFLKYDRICETMKENGWGYYGRLQTIVDRFGETADEIRIEDSHVKMEKLGEEYLITPDGDVTSDEGIAGRIENATREALSEAGYSV